MEFQKITVIGLGLIGGSLAWALKESEQVEIVVGVDTNEDSIKYAFDNELIHEGASEINEVISGSEIIVISTYVDSIADTAKTVFEFATDGAIITDVGSVKSQLVTNVESFLPENLHFVAGHPIAGTEDSGIRAADKNLFTQKRCILTPNSKTDSHAKDRVAKMWETAGSEVFEMDPAAHDHVFAIVSHLPHAVAYSLINSVADAEDSEKLLEFAGGGLKDYTRVAASSPEMWSQIFTANKEQLLEALAVFKGSLERIESAIQHEDFDSLRAELEKAAKTKRRL